MKILHICNDYCGSKVHANLYSGLDKLDVRQTVYTYYRNPSLDGKNRFESLNAEFMYRPVLKTYHRVFYHKKERDVYADLRSQMSTALTSFDLVHATTLFSDGAVALRISKQYGIPYVVTVRNTDINEFLGIAPHTWPVGVKVLENASKIVFISKAPMEKFCRHAVIKRILPNIRHKFALQPNGIDDFWLDHQNDGVRTNHHLIYVGRFDMNKNVVRLVKSVIRLRKDIPDIHLHLVGGDGVKEKTVRRLVDNYPKLLTYHGKIYDKDVLKDLYSQCSVFAMPSIHETFGLVYIEALSQGLPVLYTRNQGIDGLLDRRVGESVNALSSKSIQNGLTKLLLQRQEYTTHGVDFEQFRWNRIAERYKQIYEEVLRNGNH